MIVLTYVLALLLFIMVTLGVWLIAKKFIKDNSNNGGGLGVWKNPIVLLGVGIVASVLFLFLCHSFSSLCSGVFEGSR